MLARPLAALAVATALAALPTRAGAQGFINVAAGGGIDTEGSGTVGVRAGLFKTFGLQAAFDADFLNGHPESLDPTHPGHYRLVTGSIAFHPYLSLFSDHLGIAGHAALGLGELMSPTSTVDGSRDTRFALTAELGPELHWFPTSILGFAFTVDWRWIWVDDPFPGFPSSTPSDVVFRLWIELSFLR